MPSSPASEDEQLAVELARMEDRYKRALADLDNYRKRSARELERLVEEATDSLTREWLEVVDGVERALGQRPEGELRDGLQAVLDHMEVVLSRQGIQRIGRPGEPFDPERHSAIGVRETDEVPPGTVLEVARSGYAMGDRVLRPAEVIVSRAPQEQPASPEA
jgi:molecular chaperone GrpE